MNVSVKWKVWMSRWSEKKCMIDRSMGRQMNLVRYKLCVIFFHTLCVPSGCMLNKVWLDDFLPLVYYMHRLFQYQGFLQVVNHMMSFGDRWVCLSWSNISFPLSCIEWWEKFVVKNKQMLTRWYSMLLMFMFIPVRNVLIVILDIHRSILCISKLYLF